MTKVILIFTRTQIRGRSTEEILTKEEVVVINAPESYHACDQSDLSETPIPDLLDKLDDPNFDTSEEQISEELVIKEMILEEVNVSDTKVVTC